MPPRDLVPPETPAPAPRNAVRHGLYARAAVIGDETPEDWQRHLDDVAAALAPQGAVEVELADRAATLLWRLRRVPAAESALVARAAARQSAAAAERAAARQALGPNSFYGSAFKDPPSEPPPMPDPGALSVVIRHEAHLNRQLLHTLHELEALQQRRRGERPPLARVGVIGLPGT